MMATCPVCGKGRLRRGKVRQEMFGVDLGEYPAEICDSCGESFVDSEAMKKIEARAKAMGLWGLAKMVSRSEERRVGKEGSDEGRRRQEADDESMLLERRAEEVT